MPFLQHSPAYKLSASENDLAFPQSDFWNYEPFGGGSRTHGVEIIVNTASLCCHRFSILYYDGSTCVCQTWLLQTLLQGNRISYTRSSTALLPQTMAVTAGHGLDDTGKPTKGAYLRNGQWATLADSTQASCCKPRRSRPCRIPNSSKGTPPTNIRLPFDIPRIAGH